MFHSLFDQVLMEEALAACQKRQNFRLNVFAISVETQLQGSASVDLSYSEFWEHQDRSYSVEDDRDLLVSKLALLNEQQLKALRKTVARRLHPDLISNSKKSADLLAIINAHIDQRLKFLIRKPCSLKKE